jgi:hypothetical protein
MSASLHTIVGFVADFPMRNDGVEPAGKELAHFVHVQLRKIGLTTSSPEDREGWAWDMTTRDGELEVLSIVGLVDDMEANPPRQWLVTNDCPVPLLKRFFGKSEFEAKREALLRRLCEGLHTAMGSDSRFTHITWYNAYTFDKPGDVPTDRP